ncbi:MAG TPA: tetratricopeptide repeat protein [Candidatus Limnocylindrales bacterium]|nr:tetratricopeptide repeat protein [Candidatus Limnocylindrales bacterium]
MLFALLGLSLAIRLWGIHDRLPDASLRINVLDDSVIEETDRTTMGRAWMMWRGGTKPLDLNPHTGGWPSLSFYLTIAIEYLYKLYYSFTMDGATAAQFQQHVNGAGAAPMFLFGRIVGALIGALTVFLTYRVGAMALGRTVGLLAGLFVATNTLHVLISQHVSDPNLLALLFVLLATPPLLRVVADGSMRDSIRAGAMIGLAGACKYVPLILGLPLALAHLTRRPEDGVKRTPIFKNRALWAGLLAILAAVFVASPFLFIDWKRTVIDIAGQRRSLFSDWVGQTVFPISLPTYLAVSLPHAMGWPAYVLGLAGLVLLWREGRVKRTLVWIPIMIVLVNGMLKSPQERYILVALPFLHLAAAFAIVRGIAWARSRVPALAGGAPLGRAAPALLVVLAIGWPLPELITTRRSLSLPDSRHLARRWINQNLDPERPMGLELYGPVFSDKERAMVIWPFFATQAPLARPAYHAEFLDGLEYYLASGEISRRFESEPLKYPVENAYYRWLREHATVVWESDSKTMSGPHIVIRRLPRNISTRAQRDSVFAAAMPKPTQVNRMELWCLDHAKNFTRVGDHARAEEWARRGLLVGVESMDSPLRSQLAVSLWREGKLDSADAEMRAAVRGLPKSPTFRIYHAGILSDMGRFTDALEELKQAFELSGKDPRIRINMAQTLAQLGRFDEAISELLAVPADNPQRGLALRDAAILILNHSDRPTDALNYLKESIQLDPGQEQADLVRAQIARLEAVMKGDVGRAPRRP